MYSPNVPRCQHIKTNGTQCGSPALRNSSTKSSSTRAAWTKPYSAKMSGKTKTSPIWKKTQRKIRMKICRKMTCRKTMTMPNPQPAKKASKFKL